MAVFGSSTLRLSEIVTDAEPAKKLQHSGGSGASPGQLQARDSLGGSQGGSQGGPSPGREPGMGSGDDFEDALNVASSSPWEPSSAGEQQQQVPQQLQPLAEATAELDQMTSSVADLNSQVQDAASQESLERASRSDLESVQGLLASYAQSLRRQVQQHDTVQRTLQQLLDQQHEGKARAQAQLGAALQQIHAANSRQSALAQSQPAASQAHPPATPAAPRASSQFPGFTGPPATAMALPTPSLHPPAAFSQPVAVANAASSRPLQDPFTLQASHDLPHTYSQAPLQPDFGNFGDSNPASSYGMATGMDHSIPTSGTSAAMSHGDSRQAEDLFMQSPQSPPPDPPPTSSHPLQQPQQQQQQQPQVASANGAEPGLAASSEPPTQSIKDFDDMDLENLGSLVDAVGGAGSAMGGFGEAADGGAAADFAEQLTSAGGAQALLDALASLPQDQQNAINLAEVLHAGQAGASNGQLEEYDPTDPFQ